MKSPALQFTKSDFKIYPDVFYFYKYYKYKEKNFVKMDAFR